MKKILIISDTFYPDTTSGAKLLNDLANELKKKNKILIISAKNSDFPQFFKKLRIINKKNLKVLFVPSFFIKNKNLIIRGVCELFIGFILWHKTNTYIKRFNPNSLIVYSPSIFFSYISKKIKKNFKTKSMCILRDLFPYWAIETRYIKNYFLKIFYIYIFKKYIKIFDTIGLEANTNIKILSKLNNIDKKKYFFLPNWVNLNDFEYHKSKISKKKNFLFGGNFGGGQDVAKVIKFYKKVNSKFCKKFYLIGNGISSYLINNFIKNNLNNKIKFKDKMKQKEYLNFVKNIDFGIISLNEKISSVNFPGRLFSYLLKNKPIIMMSSKKNELSEFIEKNKIGLRYSCNMDIDNFIKQLVSISKKLNNDENHIYRILDRYFCVKKVSKLIISKI